MNYAHVLLLPIIFTALTVSAEPVRLLQQVDVNKKIVEIEKRVIRDKRAVLAVNLLEQFSNITLFVSYMTPLFSDPLPSVASSCEACKEKAKAPVEEDTSTKGFLSGLTSFGHNTKNLLTSSQYWKTIGLFCLSQSISNFIVSRIADDIVHPDTLRWYVSAHAPYKATTSIMREVIIQLHEESLEVPHKAHNKQILHDSLNRLARYGESMCAYMTYKTKQLEEYEKPVAHRATCYLFKYCNDWLAEISVLCESNEPDYDQIKQLITTYEAEIAAQLRHFYAIEGETKIEKRAMMDARE